MDLGPGFGNYVAAGAEALSSLSEKRLPRFWEDLQIRSPI